MAKWISVYDRLPSMREIVIATDGGNTWDVGQYRGSYMDRGPDRWLWHNHTEKVVHWWMPKQDALPKPGVAPEQERLGVPRGKWQKTSPITTPVCSVCGEHAIGYHAFDWWKTDFCPHCGADLREKKESEETK